MGFRVPTLLIGPYVRRGVEHTTFDHTSWLKYVCERHGIAPWTARIDAANSIGVALDTDRMAKSDAAPPIALPPWDIDEATLDAACGPGGRAARPPELEAWVKAVIPALDRSAHVAERMAAIRRRTDG